MVSPPPFLSVMKFHKGLPYLIRSVILFILFINYLPNSASSLKFILFADDSTLSTSASSLKFILFADDSTLSTSFAQENALEFTLTLNHELNNVNNWLTSNRICINADKTKYMSFSYRKLLHLTNIKIASATIEETNNIKFLGSIFNKLHTFKNHVDVITREISQSVGTLFKLSKYLPLEIIKASYSLINPFLLYGIEVCMAHMLT